MATSNEPDQSNAGEGADPSEDLKQQNPGETTTPDLSEGAKQSDDDAGAGGASPGQGQRPFTSSGG